MPSVGDAIPAYEAPIETPPYTPNLLPEVSIPIPTLPVTPEDILLLEIIQSASGGIAAHEPTPEPFVVKT
ncbi:hypothetical protein ES705_16078 [subsurface metagenome]